MQIEQPNPTKSQSQSRKNILKNRLIEINDRNNNAAGGVTNHAGDKMVGDLSSNNLNMT
jgi:hypothetical protein